MFVAGRQYLSLLVWVCARISWAPVFGWTSSLSSLLLSPVAVNGEDGRARCRDEQPAVPRLRRRDGAPAFYHDPVRTSGLATRAGARHELGDHAGGTQGAVTEGRRAKGSRDSLSFSFHWVLCKCLWEAHSPLKYNCYKCCLVSCWFGIFFCCIVFCLIVNTCIVFDSCAIKCACEMFPLHSVSFPFY